MGAMLLALAMTLTSCLGTDDDNTTQVVGTGTAYSTSKIVLDNGLSLQSSSLNLNMGDRVFVFASVDRTAYNAAVDALSKGQSASTMAATIYQGSGTMTEADVEFVDDFETELTDYPATSVSSMGWFTYGSFGNGWMNVAVKGDYFVKKESATSMKLMEPEVTVLVKECDPAGKKLTLTVVYNSRESEFMAEENKLKEGYMQYKEQEIPVTFDLSHLYTQFQNLGDETEIALSVEYVSDKNHTIASNKLDGKLGYSTNYFKVGVLKRTYGSIW